MKRLCYMLIGVPGSGKSTVAQSLLDENSQLKIASTDLLIEQYAAKKGKTYSQVHREYVDQATKGMNLQIQSMMKKGESFIWDQTNVFASARKKKLTTLLQNKYTVIAITIELSPNELQKRLTERVANGSKFVGDKIIADLLLNYSRPTYSEGFEEIYVIEDDGNSVLVAK